MELEDDQLDAFEPDPTLFSSDMNFHVRSKTFWQKHTVNMIL